VTPGYRRVNFADDGQGDGLGCATANVQPHRCAQPRAQFLRVGAQVAEQFLGYVERGALPDWEVPNMIAKYATTTRALDVARAATPSSV